MSQTLSDLTLVSVWLWIMRTSERVRYRPWPPPASLGRSSMPLLSFQPALQRSTMSHTCPRRSHRNHHRDLASLHPAPPISIGFRSTTLETLDHGYLRRISIGYRRSLVDHHHPEVVIPTMDSEHARTACPSSLIVLTTRLLTFKPTTPDHDHQLDEPGLPRPHVISTPSVTALALVERLEPNLKSLSHYRSVEEVEQGEV